MVKPGFNYSFNVKPTFAFKPLSERVVDYLLIPQV